MVSFSEQRKQLVQRQILGRGIQDPAVLAAFHEVRRESFVPPEMAEFAYLDRALPIEMGQTISQPYIVALMTEALELSPHDRVLEVGTGSGYAAAILGRIADQVYTIERHQELADQAAERLRQEGFSNVHVRHGDGTLGWAENAPYDAIVVAAGGPEIPQALLHQLAVGGKLVIPIGQGRTTQALVRVRRTSETEFEREELCDVRFVPLIGKAGWSPAAADSQLLDHRRKATGERLVAKLIRETADSISEIGPEGARPIVERAEDARLFLIGEATHGTSQFYRMRIEITKELIRRGKCSFVAIEGDWPDAARVDQYVRRVSAADGPAWDAFIRFPTWMWRNREVLEFIEWMRNYNLSIEDPQQRIGFHGLDLYSMYTSLRAVLDFLDEADPASARVARLRYGCLTPWEEDPALYGRLTISGRYRVCEDEAVAVLTDLMEQRMRYVEYGGASFFDAVQNARLVANAERYYRLMYYGSNDSWNHRDTHMFDTLELLLNYYGDHSRAVLWEHNSHLGNAAHTEMGAGGQINVGQLCRERFGHEAYLIGQGTDHGTVAAATNWDQPVQFMEVRPGYPGSYESLCHASGQAAFSLALREPHRAEIRAELDLPRLERAIGVVYRPETELASHYFNARLPEQFDTWLWFDRTTPVQPLSQADVRRLPPEHPFRLAGEYAHERN